MIQRYGLVAITLLVGLTLALPEFVVGGQARENDYVVARSVTIRSDWSIAALIFQAGTGVLDGSPFGRDSSLHAAVGSAYGIRTELSVDGVTQSGPTSPQAVWRLLGFVLWDGGGTIERTTTATVNRHYVVIRDRVENGRVWVQVVVGPPLGDPRVRCAVLELETQESGVRSFGSVLERIAASLGLVRSDNTNARQTRIRLFCSAIIDLPFDARRKRVHARRQRWGCDRPTLSEGIAQREAGAETAATIRQLESVGREVVASGQDQLTAIVNQFLRRKCP